MIRTFSTLAHVVSLAALFAVAACNQGAAGTPESCDKYAEALCAKMPGDKAGCDATKSTVSLMPPNACQAGLNDLAYTDTKLADMRKGCDELVTKLCADIGPETQSCAMVKEQTPKFPPARCAQLLQNYDDVLGDLKRRELANKPLTPELQTKIAATEAGVFGAKDSKVTIVEFSDFECPYCSKAADAVTQLKKKYGDKVRFVFRHFPLSFHPNAHIASQATLAANEQGKFWEFHDLLFQNQKALDRKSLDGYAKKLGLNMGSFAKALDSKKYAEQVEADMKLGNEVGVSGTPTMFVNGERVANPTDFGSLSALVDKALAAGG